MKTHGISQDNSRTPFRAERTPFRALYAWAANCLAGPGEFQHLYGTLHAAAIHVSMSPDCHKLGLGVLEISIAAALAQT